MGLIHGTLKSIKGLHDQANEVYFTQNILLVPADGLQPEAFPLPPDSLSPVEGLLVLGVHLHVLGRSCCCG